MVLAQRGIPNFTLTIATLIGGTLAAGSANAFNQILEQDLDVAMGRTAKRPLVVGTISTKVANLFAFFIGALSLLIFWLFTNALATFLTFIAIVFYVGVYTALLKRRTSQNIVWGGIAGCMPVLIGWSAVANSLSWSAILLFLLIFFWTPPHFWALAIKYKDDYSRAMVPMLPVVASERIVSRQMIGHTVAMVISSIALGMVAELPLWYFFIALLVGGYFIFLVLGLGRKEEQDRSKLAEQIFHGSISYLSVISLIIVVAVLV